jgi:hypothetical protein
MREGAAVSDNKTLDLFYGIFRGNTSFFVKHQAPFTEKEGKLKASWCGFAVYNKRKPPPENREDGDLIPVTKELYRNHLNGGDGLAIAPLTNTQDKRNVCFYAVIDIDVYGVNFTWLVNRLYRAGFKFAAFLSKSGGLHIYFFFAEAEPGDRVIETLEKFVEVYGLGRLFVNGKNKSKVEIFPKQAVFVPGDKNVNCLFLPFYNAANKSKQNMLTAEGKLIGITKALPVIENMFTSVKELDSTLDVLPYGDAPYCVQMVLLTGALAENDGRNNFLFSAAIYLKKKYKDDFKDALQEMNDCLESPLEQKDIDNIYTSVTTNGYDNYSCKRSPCADYCDRKICALREYGVGRQKNNRFTGADCWGTISRMMAAQPYYLWEVRINPDEEFRKVRVESERDLHNQSVIQESCWRDLNWAPFRVKDNDWIATVNQSMEGIEGRQIPVPKSTDTTEMGELYGLFIQYLTRRRAQNGQPYMVRLDQVYYAEGIYYFTTKGIMAFLRYERFSTGKVNLREQLIACGCSEAELRYKTLRGEERIIPCWKKPEDADLLEQEIFYGDMSDADEEILQSITPETEREEGGSDEGVKF